ncbi:UNVERIFIED_CONTAM: Retrovirus-related Pol polyprotein from transposon RE2 [Sesamum latifolium]|uniref:Retrovirus-related Pol polyprotein from transposon RE2 n=1 Tax=Sesamum latifolium TaxID=2727402 RepID=A0AAW2VDG9_9LAMI
MAVSGLEFGEYREPVNLHTETSLRRSEWVRQPSTRLRDYVCHTVYCLDPSYVPPASSSSSIRDSSWREAMKAEIDALERNGTWTITDLSLDKKAIGCKWVYKIKYNSDGIIEHFKARLIVLGKNQVEGIDYHETFAPV